MTTTFDCTLNGVSLSSLYGRICVTDIIEDAPRMHETSLPLQSGGQRVLTRVRQSISVRVRFTLLEELPIARRHVAGDILRWASQAGYLTISTRPGQRLHVTCTDMPGLSSQDWAQELTLTFTSTFAPWWEDAEATSIKGTGTMSLVIPGTADETPVEVILLNTGTSTVTEVTVHCGPSHVTFQGIALPPSGQMVINRVNGHFTAAVAGNSVLHCRTMDSSDDLLVPCGESALMYVTASQALYAFYHVRGRYL